MTISQLHCTDTDAFSRKGNYAFALGRLEGAIKNACIDLKYSENPRIVADTLRRALTETLNDLEGNPEKDWEQLPEVSRSASQG